MISKTNKTRRNNRKIFFKGRPFRFQGDLARKSKEWNQYEQEIILPASLTLFFVDQIGFRRNKTKNQFAFMICFDTETTQYLANEHHQILVNFDAAVKK